MSFFIEKKKKYYDNVWYDVILVDGCHVLLGRP
jgi:hypothetical protein